jgi:hypothetical protein
MQKQTQECEVFGAVWQESSQHCVETTARNLHEKKLCKTEGSSGKLWSHAEIIDMRLRVAARHWQFIAGI